MSSASPFSPSFGNRPNRLVGRDGILDRLVRGLQQEAGSRDRAVVLLGQRGMGKTVLLWELAERARQLGYVVANPTTATEDMLDRIVEKIQTDGQRHEVRGPASVSSASIGALGFSVGLQFTRETMETKSFHYKVRSLCKRLDRRVLILVDELQANTPEMRNLVSTYQELVGEGIDVAMVLAGLPGAVSGTLNDRVLTFLNRATRIELEPLAIGEVDAFFASSFAELGIVIEEDLRRKAAAATEGSPYLMQLVGYYLTQYAQGPVIDARALADALKSASEDYERDVCETTIASLSQRDVEFLEAMAMDEGSSRMTDIAMRMDVTPDYAQKYRRRLLSSGVIKVVRRGEVGFAVPLLADWLRRKWSDS